MASRSNHRKGKEDKISTGIKGLKSATTQFEKGQKEMSRTFQEFGAVMAKARENQRQERAQQEQMIALNAKAELLEQMMAQQGCPQNVNRYNQHY